MRKYKVILHPDAETDIGSSYQWGCQFWGKERAAAWVRELRGTIKSRLTTMPLSCSIAPESADLDAELRQLIVQRYRVLFILEKRTVTILHVRGPYVREIESSEVDEE